jgi:hypothetical protein
VVVGPYTYLIGGAADGSLARSNLTATAPASFAAYNAAALQNARNSAGAVVIGNQLYVFGGGFLSLESAPLK